MEKSSWLKEILRGIKNNLYLKEATTINIAGNTVMVNYFHLRMKKQFEELIVYLKGRNQQDLKEEWGEHFVEKAINTVN